MIRYVLARLLFAVVTVWFVMSTTFLLIQVLPGDPVTAYAGPHAPPETVQAIRRELGLDRPAAIRYLEWLGRAARGDMGTSIASGRPVKDVIVEHAPATLLLAVAVVVLQLSLGVLLGVLSAARGGQLDRATRLLIAAGQSLPTFVLGFGLLYLLAFRAEWFPVGGYGDNFAQRLWHLVLPALTLAIGGMAVYARVVRSEVKDVLGQDFVRAARARGMGEPRILARHVLPHALHPIVALVGTDLGFLVSGAVVTESIFGWPGIGREAYLAVLHQDTPVLLGIVLVTAVSVTLANLAADLVAPWLDPRLRA